MLLRLLVGFERLVADTEQPAYVRAFAWFKLYRHWAALRWDDTDGLKPSSFQRRARGVFAKLSRSKSGGPVKQVSVLPLWVSYSAFVECGDWLSLGLEIWESEAFAYERDYLLPLPSPDLKGVLRRRAEYSDAVAMSRQLVL